MNTALLSALREIEVDKGIPFETVVGVLEDSLLTAYYGREEEPEEKEERRVVLDRETGDIRVLKDGDDVTPADLTRVLAGVMRQNFLQRLNEVHNEQLMEEYGGRMGDIVTGIVQQAHRRMTLVDLGRVEAILPASEQVPNERYENGQRIKVFLSEIREPGRGPSLVVSRRHEGLLRGLFELEVPEIYDRLVEIRAVAREAGLRSKVAVWSNEPGIDPVGACVGPRGSRVRAVVSELRNEKIDIIQWDPDPARFIAKALSPARVREVYLDDDEQQAEVIVPDDQLSLAIGREGQNARLAVKLTEWKIDIKPESQATEFEDDVEEDWEPDEGSAMHRCRAVLANGRRCANTALPGSLFCGIPSHQAQAAEFEGS